jgi:hypothetical protein
MRKAGSTSLRAFFASLGQARGWGVQANEFLALNAKCLGHPVVSRRVLLVTHLREPLARLNSEFFYGERGATSPSSGNGPS